MNFEFEANSLSEALRLAGSVITRAEMMPIMSHVLLTAGPDGGELRSMNPAMEMAVVVPIHAPKPVRVAVPGKKFVDIVKAMSDGTIKCVVDDDKMQMVMRAGRSRFTLSILDAADFPAMPDEETSIAVTVPCADLLKALARAEPAMATNDVRYYLNGALLEMGGTGLRAVATNGHWIAISDAHLAQTIESVDILVPRRGIEALLKLLDNGDDATVEIGATRLRVTVGGARLSITAIDGRFPEYKKLIPNGGTPLLVDRRLLAGALRAMRVISDTDRYGGVVFDLKTGSLTLAARNQNGELGSMDLEVVYSGPAMAIGFNPEYLAKAIEEIENEQVRIDFHGVDRGAVIRSEDYTALIMPMRL